MWPCRPTPWPLGPCRSTPQISYPCATTSYQEMQWKMPNLFVSLAWKVLKAKAVCSRECPNLGGNCTYCKHCHHTRCTFLHCTLQTLPLKIMSIHCTLVIFIVQIVHCSPWRFWFHQQRRQYQCTVGRKEDLQTLVTINLVSHNV